LQRWRARKFGRPGCIRLPAANVSVMRSSGPDDLAVVIGAGGGIGGALAAALAGRMRVIGLGRRSEPPLDLLSEASIRDAASFVAAAGVPRLIIDATGFLHGDGFMPEKTYAALDAAQLAHGFAINAIGPALLMKHFLPLLPKLEPSLFASLSARVGSIGDNAIGGWYSYRAAKAALNQLLHCAAIELKVKKPGVICVAIHPGTVATPLSAPFAKSGLNVRPPEVAAAEILAVLDGLTPAQSGGFYDYRGESLPW
jgi:NAD(P)-dependent dehydrogenase (short-subunit alcohol dehydrogenase family)